MLTVHPQYIKDTNGNNSMVILPAQEFLNLIKELEELEDICSYDEAKKMILASVYQWKKPLE